MTFRPRRPSLGATLNASVEGRPPRWDAPSTLAPVLPTDPPPPAPHTGSLRPLLAGLTVGEPAQRPTHDDSHAQLMISGLAA